VSVDVTDPVFEDWTYDPHPLTQFGPIVSAFDVEWLLAQTVQRWICDYLAEIERQHQLRPGGLPVFRSVVVSQELGKFPEDQLPAFLIASPGIEPTSRGSAGRLEVSGDGYYTTRWRVECASHVAARGNRLAVRNARLYAAAVRALLVQKALGDTGALQVRRVDWTAERYGLLDSDAERTICAGVVGVGVEVAQTLNRQLGPPEPHCPDPDPVLMGEVDSAHVDVRKRQEDC